MLIVDSLVLNMYIIGGFMRPLFIDEAICRRSTATPEQGFVLRGNQRWSIFKSVYLNYVLYLRTFLQAQPQTHNIVFMIR